MNRRFPRTAMDEFKVRNGPKADPRIGMINAAFVHTAAHCLDRNKRLLSGRPELPRAGLPPNGP